MAHETCNGCGTDYDYTNDNAWIQLFLRHPWCNYVGAICPGCGVYERIYITPEGYMQLMEIKLKVYTADNAPDDIQTSALSTLGWTRKPADPCAEPPPSAPVSEEPKALLSGNWVRDEDLPQIPRSWLTNLWDTFREFGGES